jgi:hypothetical protein
MIRKQLITVFALVMLVVAGIAAIEPPKGKHKNLKILPQDISNEKLDSIMESYNKALSVSCSFCHTAPKDSTEKIDFADDRNPMKTEARKMMEMTISLNKTYFYHDKNERPEYLKVIHCMVCHRGEAYPHTDAVR